MQGGGERREERGWDSKLRHLLHPIETGTDEGGITQEIPGLHLEKGQEDS